MTKNYLDDVPEDFRCPITHEVMRYPLMTRSGQSFERNAILTWLECHNHQCPLTRKTLNITNLIRNLSLQVRIDEWHRVRGIPFREEEDDDMEPRILLTCSREDLPMQEPHKTFKKTDGDKKGGNMRKRKTLLRFFPIGKSI
jgi:U-box domain